MVSESSDQSLDESQRSQRSLPVSQRSLELESSRRGSGRLSDVSKSTRSLPVSFKGDNVSQSLNEVRRFCLGR